MSRFDQAFWSHDYAGGLGILFGKLQQGVQENSQVLTIARMRADAEELYGQHMGDIGPATDRIANGFSRDDGASAYDGVRTEMLEASQKHQKIASNIRELVVYPFGRWCEQHASRVQNSQDDLQSRIKQHDRQADTVRKLRSHYFNKCRLVEDLEEEDKLAFKDPQSDTSSPKAPTPTIRIAQEPPDEEEEPEPVEIGDNVYPPEQIKRIMSHMLENVPMKDQKIPILGTYSNVSVGSDIVEYIQKHLNGTSVAYAERMGQDLIENGFLRLIGNVGNTFANSSRISYQWRPKVFKLTGFPEKKKALERSNTTMSSMSVEGLDSPLVGTVGEYLQGWNPLNNPYPNETPSQKLRREAREADERYKSGVKKLDTLRCSLEEAMIEHLRFMERCELDRLKAIKSVVLDFSGAISNVIPSLQSTVDKMMLFQETVQPLGDLRYLLENYRTGPYIPKVQPYENYYNSVDQQTFGIDLEARARADRKRVPLIITTILTHLDNTYPLLDGDSARQAIWLVDVPLSTTHRLRSDLNTGEPPSLDTLAQYDPPVVASALKLYLLELPDSLVSSGLYEVIKTIYTTPATSDVSPDSAQTSTRISVLQNTLGQLRLANIASLDALTTHFARLIELTSAPDDYVDKLVATLAPCALRARPEARALQFEDKSPTRFLRDLLTHKDAIFGELKRASSLQHSASVMRAQSVSIPHHVAAHDISAADPESRARATSGGTATTGESNRRANMEERNRAIASANRSRASSPQPGSRAAGSQDHGHLPRNHRRDSSRGPETRFPVNVAGHAHVEPPRIGSPRASSAAAAAQKHTSLEVPGSPASSSFAGAGASVHPHPGHTADENVNGTTAAGADESASITSPEKDKPLPDTPDVHKRNSLERRFPRKAGGTSVTSVGSAAHKADNRQSSGSYGTGTGRSSLEGKRESAGSGVGARGVELVDRPMDD